MTKTIFCNFVETFIDKKYYLMVFDGIFSTLSITTIAIIIGILIGILLVGMQIISLSKNYRFLQKSLNVLARIYIDFIRGTPVIVQLTFIWIVAFSSVNISKILVGGIAFGLNSGAYVAELIRAGIESIDGGQNEACLSLGLTKFQSLKYVILPQAWRKMLPSFVNEFIALIKETSIIGVVGGLDIMRAGNIMISNTGNAIFPLIIVAICYLFLTTILSFFMRRLEIKLKQKLN